MLQHMYYSGESLSRDLHLSTSGVSRSRLNIFNVKLLADSKQNGIDMVGVPLQPICSIDYTRCWWLYVRKYPKAFRLEQAIAKSLSAQVLSLSRYINVSIEVGVKSKISFSLTSNMGLFNFQFFEHLDHWIRFGSTLIQVANLTNNTPNVDRLFLSADHLMYYGVIKYLRNVN